MTARVNPELVAAVCRAAATMVGARAGAVEVVVDPLDTSLWVHLPAPAAVTAAVTALRARGLDTTGVNDHRLHVTGWDVRLLRWRLGVLLAAVDDLTAATDLTTDLDTLLQLTAAAAEEVQRLIAVHLDRAEHVLTVLTPGPDQST